MKYFHKNPTNPVPLFFFISRLCIRLQTLFLLDISKIIINHYFLLKIETNIQILNAEEFLMQLKGAETFVNQSGALKWPNSHTGPQ